MNSKDIFEKITKRNKYVIKCGALRNSAYLEYLKASMQYDSLKKAFYTSVELARLDRNIPEEQLQRYEHLVKHYDKQLVSQLKDRNNDVNKINLNDEVDEEEKIDKEKNPFADRISKIETAGYSRNRHYYEFCDNKIDLEKAKKLFHNETLLAVEDGLITDIDQEMHCESHKKIVSELEEEIVAFRLEYTRGRHVHNIGRGRGTILGGIRGHGGSTRGHGGSTRGHGGSTRGHGGSTRGHGGSTRGHGGSTRGGRNRGRFYGNRGRFNGNGRGGNPGGINKR